VRGLAVVAALPDRSDGMDHETGREREALGGAGVPCGAATEPAACFFQARPGGPENRAADPAAAGQGVVGRVDDRIDVSGGEVAIDHGQVRVSLQSYGF